MGDRGDSKGDSKDIKKSSESQTSEVGFCRSKRTIPLINLFESDSILHISGTAMRFLGRLDKLINQRHYVHNAIHYLNMQVNHKTTMSLPWPAIAR